MSDDRREIEQAESVEIQPHPTRAAEDIAVSRALAVDRVFKGGVLACFGFGGALLMDLLSLSPGVPFWIGIAATLTSFGAGAIWAGSGASHLIRHGRKGSSLWLISLAGLGGSVILSVASGILAAAWGFPILGALNRLSAAFCGLFTASLIVLGLIAIVRWMLPDAETAYEGSVSGQPEIE